MFLYPSNEGCGESIQSTMIVSAHHYRASDGDRFRGF